MIREMEAEFKKDMAAIFKKANAGFEVKTYQTGFSADSEAEAYEKLVGMPSSVFGPSK